MITGSAGSVMERLFAAGAWGERRIIVVLVVADDAVGTDTAANDGAGA